MEFTLTAKFNTSSEVLFSTWLDSDGHSKMTGGLAEISNKVGDSYTAWDGYINGKNIEIEPYQRIVQSWRASEFEEHHEDSRLELLFKDVNGHIELTLIHSNLPDAIGERYIKGWEDYYFTPMKAFFP